MKNKFNKLAALILIIVNILHPMGQLYANSKPETGLVFPKINKGKTNKNSRDDKDKADKNSSVNIFYPMGELYARKNTRFNSKPRVGHIFPTKIKEILKVNKYYFCVPVAVLGVGIFIVYKKNSSINVDQIIADLGEFVDFENVLIKSQNLLKLRELVRNDEKNSWKSPVDAKLVEKGINEINAFLDLIKNLLKYVKSHPESKEHLCNLQKSLIVLRFLVLYDGRYNDGILYHDELSKPEKNFGQQVIDVLHDPGLCGSFDEGDEYTEFIKRDCPLEKISQAIKFVKNNIKLIKKFENKF